MIRIYDMASGALLETGSQPQSPSMVPRQEPHDLSSPSLQLQAIPLAQHDPSHRFAPALIAQTVDRLFNSSR